MNKSVLYLHNKYIFIFSIVAILFGLVVNQEAYSVTIYSAIVFLFLIVFLSLYKTSIKLKRKQFILILMLSSLILKIISVFVFEELMLNIVGIPFLSFKDDYTYNEVSSKILNAWVTRGFGFYSDVRFGVGFYSGYPNVSALAKWMFGDHYLVPRFLNVFFSVLTIPFAFSTINILTDNKRHAKLVAILIAFSPAFIIYSSLQLKDTILIFFVSTLIYGTAIFFLNGFSKRSIIIVAFSMAALLFFRAAILLPYLVAVLFSVLVVKDNVKNKLKSIVWAVVIVFLFYFVWEVIYSAGLLTGNGEMYFETRLENRGASEKYQGSNSLGGLGFIAVLLSPILIVLSLFLPTPVYLDLEPLTNSVPYHYLSLIGYYSILPMALISFFYVLKNYRIHKVGLFIVVFLFLYKVGQAGSQSIFDSRQSLPAIYMIYILLAYFDIRRIEIVTLWRKYRTLILFLLLATIFSFSFFRYLIRL